MNISYLKYINLYLLELPGDIIDNELISYNKCAFSGTVVRVDSVKVDECINHVYIYISGNSGIFTANAIESNNCLIDGFSLVYTNNLPKIGDNVDFLIGNTLISQGKIISNNKVEGKYQLLGGTILEDEFKVCESQYDDLSQIPNISKNFNYNITILLIIFILIIVVYIFKRYNKFNNLF